MSWSRAFGIAPLLSINHKKRDLALDLKSAAASNGFSRLRRAYVWRGRVASTSSRHLLGDPPSHGKLRWVL
jgi:hypothetical protein